MKRREFIAGLGGVVVASPAVTWAQQPGLVRRVGVLMLTEERDPFTQSILAGFRKGLQGLGWPEDGKLQLDVRFAAHDNNLINKFAQELVSLAPDLIVTMGPATTLAVRQQTQIRPIVFVAVSDPVSNGLIKSIARPEANITGISNLFYSMGGKWVQLLKEAAPRTRMIGVLTFSNLNQPIGLYFPETEKAATSLGLQ